MQFVPLVVLVGGSALVSLAVLVPYCVDRDRIDAVVKSRERRRRRLRAVAPYLGGLTLVLLVNKGLLRRLETLSRAHGVRATQWFYELEGNAVATVQSAVPEWGVYVFGPVYVLGYVVVLTLPLVAYVFATNAHALKTLVTAYAVEYLAAIACYTAVFAYGPRNYHRLPGADPSAARVEAPLLEAFRSVTRLTARVNVETNVFPSMHAALSITVFLVAVSTHDEFPRWTGVASVLVASILLSTLYLGVHWVTDLVAGGVLAVGGVTVADRIVSRGDRASW
jgi:membrane-associated phospholipid phosphatase